MRCAVPRARRRRRSTPSRCRAPSRCWSTAIESEYLRYFTRTGGPPGSGRPRRDRLRAADEELARCAAAIAEVDDAVRRHGALAGELVRLAAERADGVKRRETAQAAADAVAALKAQLKEAELVAAAAQAGHASAVAAVNERRRLRTEIDETAVVIAELEVAAAQAVEALATATEVQEAAEVAAGQARAAVDIAQTRAEAARRTADQLAARDEADRLASRLAKITAAQRELDGIRSVLAGIALTDEGMRAIEAAKAAVDVAMGQVELASAHVELTAITEVEVRLGGRPVALAAGQTWSASVSAQTDIDVPGVLSARLSPGTPASETQAKLDAAQDVLTAALADGGIGDIVAARDLNQRRQQLKATRDRLGATIDALLGDETPDLLRTRLAEVTERQPTASDLFDIDIDIDTDAARAELAAAAAAFQQTIADCETHRKVAEAAAKQLGERETQATRAWREAGYRAGPDLPGT